MFCVHLVSDKGKMAGRELKDVDIYLFVVFWVVVSAMWSIMYVYSKSRVVDGSL